MAPREDLYNCHRLIDRTGPVYHSELHMAAEAGDLRSCKILVRSGADLNIINWEERTPYDLAVMNNHSIVARYLRKKMDQRALY